MVKPDVRHELERLKDFQRRTAEHVFRRLYTDPDAGRRFLVADEVGLGKTVVARGVIAKTVEHLWDSVERIDVVYICSNGDIARQNIDRLKLDGQGGFGYAERLTLLPLHLHKFHPKLNFVSFSPGTSFDLSQTFGTRTERALLYHLVSKAWGVNSASAKNVMQGGVRDAGVWRAYLDWFVGSLSADDDVSQGENTPRIDRAFEGAFVDTLRGRIDLRARFDELQTFYSTRRADPSREQKEKRSTFVGDLRQLLAEHCVRLLQPDLVIMDEFQRFPHLLRSKDEIAHLAQQLFDHVDCRVLLLSATPYKMQTSATAGDVEEHYDEFIKTIDFLLQSPTKLAELKASLKRHRHAMVADSCSDEDRLQAKLDVERVLCKVVSRTERLAGTPDRNGMLSEVASDVREVSVQDLRAYRTYDRVAAAVGAREVTELWKSAPYLLNFMDEYDLKYRVESAVQRDDPALRDAVSNDPESFIRQADLDNYLAVHPANGRVRNLIADTLDVGAWKWLWMPPSLPYYAPQGAYAAAEAREATKTLIFSSWKVAPKAIAALVSYEAERRMMLLGNSQARQSDRPEGPLKVEIKDGRPDGTASFTSLYPCYVFARDVDPLLIAADLTRAERPCSVAEVRAAALAKISPMIRRLLAESRMVGNEDHRWYWAAPLFIDAEAEVDVEAMLRPKPKEGEAPAVAPGSAFERHIDHMLDWLRQYRNGDGERLGKYPNDLLQVLVNMALGGAATCAFRSMLRVFSQALNRPESSLSARQFAVQAGPAALEAGRGFQSLFNVPENVSLIRALHPGEPYWQRILEYAVDGNLQAVLDEYVHVLAESQSVNTRKVEEVSKIGVGIRDAASLRATVVHFDEFRVDNAGKLGTVREKTRCRFALRFGEGEPEDGTEATREDHVRFTFNSPFRPFVLASTSVGQEGLDFHSYCHAIYHWNLPSNPVDLEQREGRIHRFKGLVVRKNAAAKLGLTPRFRSDEDPWITIFAAAADANSKDSDLVPYWLLPGEFKIQRHVPLYPASRDAQFYQALKRTLTMYRMAFGQPRQDDLLRLLAQRAESSKQDLMRWCISLSPPGA